MRLDLEKEVKRLNEIAAGMKAEIQRLERADSLLVDKDKELALEKVSM